MDWNLERVLAIIGAIAIPAGIAVGIAMDTKTVGELRFVQGCFIVSALLTVVFATIWGVTTDGPAGRRILVVFLLYGVSGFGLVEAIRWSQARHDAAGGKETPPAGKGTTADEPLPTPAPVIPPSPKSGYTPPSPPKKVCSVDVHVSSEMMGVLHSHATWLLGAADSTIAKPVFQDLFHEWKIELTPQGQVTGVVVTIQDGREPADRVQVVPPEHAEVSMVHKGWASGFEEPNQVPDYYTREVKFETLAAPVTITLRKPVKSPRTGQNLLSMWDLDLDRNIRVVSNDCKIAQGASPRIEERFAVLMKQLTVLGAKDWAHPGDPTVPTRLDPDEPYPPLGSNEVEILTDVRCKDPECTGFLVNTHLSPRRVITPPQ